MSAGSDGSASTGELSVSGIVHQFFQEDVKKWLLML
jgi:hypothetical protein